MLKGVKIPVETLSSEFTEGLVFTYGIPPLICHSEDLGVDDQVQTMKEGVG